MGSVVYSKDGRKSGSEGWMEDGDGQIGVMASVVWEENRDRGVGEVDW